MLSKGALLGCLVELSLPETPWKRKLFFVKGFYRPSTHKYLYIYGIENCNCYVQDFEAGFFGLGWAQEGPRGFCV